MGRNGRAWRHLWRLHTTLKDRQFARLWLAIVRWIRQCRGLGRCVMATGRSLHDLWRKHNAPTWFPSQPFYLVRMARTTAFALGGLTFDHARLAPSSDTLPARRVERQQLIPRDWSEAPPRTARRLCQNRRCGLWLYQWWVPDARRSGLFRRRRLRQIYLH